MIVYNHFNPITFNGTMLPHGLELPLLHFTDEDPISPPCSPRSEDEPIPQNPRIIFHERYRVVRYCHWITYYETMKIKQRQYKFSNFPAKKKGYMNNKNMRKRHRVHQPGFDTQRRPVKK